MVFVISTDAHLAKSLFSCLDQNCWRLLMHFHWCPSRIFSNAFQFLAGKPANLAPKLCKWQIIYTWWFLTDSFGSRASWLFTKSPRRSPGKVDWHLRNLRFNVTRWHQSECLSNKCFDLRRVLQVDSELIPIVHSSQRFKLTLPNLLVRTSPPISKISNWFKLHENTSINQMFICILSWLVNLPPPNVPPPRNKGLIRPY